MASEAEGAEGGVRGAHGPPEPHSSPSEQVEGARGGIGSPRCPLVPRGGTRRGRRTNFLELAALIVDNGSCITNSGFACSVLTLYPLRLWSGPSCWTSWTVWTRFTVFALVVDPGNGLCWAGFAGIVPRAVFLFVVVRPKMLRIMAVMTQRDSFSMALLVLHLALCSFLSFAGP